MTKKTYRGAFELKADGQPGAFRATFATFNVIDKDGDVTIPGAFSEGQAVRIAAWGHNWGEPAIGKGVIGQDDARVWVDGEFFLDMDSAKETYQSVKGSGELQEWSYSFDVKEESFGEFEGKRVRFLRAMDVHEVSPVMLGAGVDTHTDAIKGAKEDALTDIKRAAEALVAAVDRVIGSTEVEGRAKDEAGNGKSEGDELGKDGAPVHVLSNAARIELELLAH